MQYDGVHIYASLYMCGLFAYITRFIYLWITATYIWFNGASHKSSVSFDENASTSAYTIQRMANLFYIVVSFMLISSKECSRAIVFAEARIIY